MDRIARTLEYLKKINFKPELDAENGKISFPCWGSSTFTGFYKAQVSSILGTSLIKFYYQNDTQIIYYKANNTADKISELQENITKLLKEFYDDTELVVSGLEVSALSTSNSLGDKEVFDFKCNAILQIL